MKNGAFKSLLILLSIFLCSPSFASTSPLPHESLSPIIKPIMKSVVNIAAQGEIMIPIVLNRPQGSSPQKRDDQQDEENGGSALPYGTLRQFASLGSGVVIDASKGFIMTNAHVVDKAKTITVTLSDGRTFKGKIIGADAATDIAIVHITADKLVQMPIGDSSKLQVGDYVLAIGSPFGLNQTVTSGIVSALQRGSLGIEGPQGLENFIQTDASINPGNSGGALIDLKGELIGINTAILSPSGAEGGNVGIGFAIPINMARVIAAQLIEYGSVKRGLMGVIVQPLTPQLSSVFGVSTTEGAIVTQVTPNSPAAAAGLQPGDIIQTLNDVRMNTASDVRNAVGLLRVGAKINISLLRHGKAISINLITSDPEKYLEKARNQNPFLFGLSLRNFDQQTPLQGYIEGVQIVRVSKDSAGWRQGLQPGDVIISANQVNVKNLNDLEKAASQNSKHLLLNILRGSGAMFVVLE
jgi:serine protease Do